MVIASTLKHQFLYKYIKSIKIVQDAGKSESIAMLEHEFNEETDKVYKIICRIDVGRNRKAIFTPLVRSR